MQVDIDMGTTAGGEAARLDIEQLLATRLLVQGNSGSGKSHLLRRLLEQSAPWVQQVVIDPEGDFVTLAEAFGHVVVDAERSEGELVGIANRIRQHRVSCVLTLEGLEIDDQMRAAANFLNALFDADREFWYPVLVVVDEAQMFAPAAAGEVAEDARRASLGAMTNLMCRGRKRGLAGVIATQRLAKLAKNVAAEASNFLMGRTFLDIDMARAADLLGMDRRQAEQFRDLSCGRFVALGPALSRRPLPVTIGPVETGARSSSPKLMPLPEKLEDVEDLILTPVPEDFSRPTAPRRAAPSPRATPDIMQELSRAATRQQDEPEAEAESVVRRPAMSAEELEDWLGRTIADIVAGGGSAFRADAELYQDFLLRGRMSRIVGAPLTMADFRLRLAVARSGVDDEMAATDAWKTALSLVRLVTDDLQGVLLILARAALAGEPCPSDAAIAYAYGTHSARRARRFLDYFEERGLIVVHADRAGLRFVAFPDLDAQTAGGDPDAALPDPAAADAAE
ncbi:ATP-binding protein [Hartmannibacter diazotrophicus]|uniref:ATP-binding protein n=1 Tax=Hartmannibacter diazotrophicus TaxID=1482074 RepID=A0A2C9DAG4_9HYPH|nr:ATP-binding protein [Hartmannibacter diazotrophicus]SON57118.1 ATP-binding protein [Hartmannibacter diazotrophicus]